MIKIRSILVFAVIPLIAGYGFAAFHTQKSVHHGSASFNTSAILPNDSITLAEDGNIFIVSHSNLQQITQNQNLIEPVQLGNAYLAIRKETNYSALEKFNAAGSKVDTLINGDTGNIDTMDWVTDPSIDPSEEHIAFVSDMDKAKTNVLDNALFVQDVQTGDRTKVVKPDPHSGGIAHPVWNPAISTIIAFDYYQYDSQTLNPYSVIMTYDTQSKATNTLTTEKQNAYQGSYSPDGKQFIFLGRNEDYSVSMYLSQVTETGLASPTKIATGDFAYPAFSNTPNHMYFLKAEGNSGYDLYTATIKNDTLINITAITSSEAIKANSGFSITRVKVTQN